MKLFNVIETTFENYDNTVRTYLSKVFDNLGLQYTHSQIFGVIFDGMKGIMQNIMFYIEDAFTEQNIFNASRKQSIYSLAKISGFEPFYGSASRGILLAELKVNNGLDNTTSNIYINNHSTVVNKKTGMTYSIILPTDYYVFSISDPLVKYEINIIQGTFIKNSYIAKGYELEAIHVNNLELFDREYIKVCVNGEEYEQVSSFYDMTENGKEYLLSIGYDNMFDVIFGNDIYGKKLTEGDVIEVEYLKHQGQLGNIKVDEISDFSFTSYSTDTLGNSINPNNFINLSISTSVSGGNNSDSIEFIRDMIGNNSRSLVYASEDNIKLFLKRFSFVGYNNIFVSQKNNKIYILAIQNIQNTLIKKDLNEYLNLSDDDLMMTKDQKNMIQTTLENSNRLLSGYSIEFINPIFRKYAIICYVKPANNYNKSVIKELISTTILNYFINLNASKKIISKSELIQLILDADKDKNIEILELTFISEYNEQAYANNSYDNYDDLLDNYILNIQKNKYNINLHLGLDDFGNIALYTNVEIPRLYKYVTYYPNKENDNQSTNIKISGIEINFI